MQAVTVREVELMLEAGARVTDLRLVRVPYKKKKPCYQIEFTLIGRNASQPSMLITTRNEPHRWMDLNRAAAFVERLFPDMPEFRVVLSQ